jgi:hypothetical protein
VAALVNLGLLHMHLARHDDADRAFAEARELAEVIGDMGMRITVELDIAKLRLRQRRHGRRARSRSARARSPSARAPRTPTARPRTSTASSRAPTASWPRPKGTSSARREIAQRRSDMILEGETARELAALYREQGRNRQTLQR